MTHYSYLEGMFTVYEFFNPILPNFDRNEIHCTLTHFNIYK